MKTSEVLEAGYREGTTHARPFARQQRLAAMPEVGVNYEAIDDDYPSEELRQKIGGRGSFAGMGDFAIDVEDILGQRIPGAPSGNAVVRFAEIQTLLQAADYARAGFNESAAHGRRFSGNTRTLWANAAQLYFTAFQRAVQGALGVESLTDVLSSIRDADNAASKARASESSGTSSGASVPAPTTPGGGGGGGGKQGMSTLALFGIAAGATTAGLLGWNWYRKRR
jgi:hypothetical protein